MDSPQDQLLSDSGEDGGRIDGRQQQPLHRKYGSIPATTVNGASEPSHGRDASVGPSFARCRLGPSSGPSLIAIDMVVLVLAIAFGSTVGIVPGIMTQRFARLRYGYEGEDCHTFGVDEKPEECVSASKDAQTAAALSELCANTLTLVTSSLIGSISDVHGRRGLFILGIFLSSIGPFVLLATELRPDTSAMVYYVGRSLHGIVSWMAVALSSIADVMPPQKRAAGVGMLMAGFWLGLCLAPSLAIFLGHLQVIAVSCVLQAMALSFAVLFLPETLPLHVAEEARMRRIQSEASVKQGVENKFLSAVARPLREMAILNRNPFFRLLSTLAFFNGMVTSGDQTLLLYYVDSVLSFSSADIAIMFLMVGMCSVMAQAVLLKPLVECIGERWIVVLCFAAATVSNTMYGLAHDRKGVYAAVCLGALTGMAFPTISAIKANNVDASEQGRIQGALYAIQAISAGVGPTSMRSVDAIAKKSGLPPGTMFFFAACLQSIALCLAYQLPKDKANSKENRTRDVQQ